MEFSEKYKNKLKVLKGKMTQNQYLTNVINHFYSRLKREEQALLEEKELELDSKTVAKLEVLSGLDNKTPLQYLEAILDLNCPDIKDKKKLTDTEKVLME